VAEKRQRFENFLGHGGLVRQWLVLGCVAAWLVSCTPIPPGEPFLGLTEVSGPRIRGHFAALNASHMSGRKTSSVGFAVAAQYVASQLQSYGLQPVHPSQFRHVSYGPINHASGASVRVLGRDTTFWFADQQMIPDPRTAAAQFQAGSYRFVPDSASVGDADPGEVAIIGPGWSARGVEALIRAGYSMALVARNPQPGRAAFSLDLGLMQVSLPRLAEILDIEEEALPGLLRDGGTGVASLEFGVTATRDGAAGLVNTLAYLPGSSPFVSDRLIVVAANLDSGGYPAGVPIVDHDRSGIAAAAVVELARVLAHNADLGEGPDRTVLFAWFAGGAQGCSGLRAFLANPVWPQDHIDAVVFAGFRGDCERVARMTPNLVRIGTDALPAGFSASRTDSAGRALGMQLQEAVRLASRLRSEDDSRH
jgi:peptidase M28-like protein